MMSCILGWEILMLYFEVCPDVQADICVYLGSPVWECMSARTWSLHLRGRVGVEVC